MVPEEITVVILGHILAAEFHDMATFLDALGITAKHNRSEEALRKDVYEQLKFCMPAEKPPPQVARGFNRLAQGKPLNE